MLYIVEKALDELESVPSEKREGLKHLDQEINDAVEKLKILKEKLKAAGKKSLERKIEWLIGNRLCDYSTG